MTTPLDLLDAEPVWSWSTALATRFNEQIANYLSVVTRLKRVPSRTDRTEGSKSAARFVIWSRQLYKQNKLPLYRVRRLEGLPFWVWGPRDYVMSTRVQRVRAFVLKHGRLPNSIRENRDALDLKAAYRKGTLVQAHIDACNSIPGWRWPTTRSSLFGIRIAAIVQFVHNKGYEPTAPSTDHGESLLGKTLSKARHMYRNGRLATDRVLLCETIPGFVWEPDPIENRLKRQQGINQKENK